MVLYGPFGLWGDGGWPSPIVCLLAILVWGSYYWQILKLVVLLLIPPHILCRKEWPVEARLLTYLLGNK